MENSFASSATDPLLLLKERIIKTETLLDKYACLTKKFNDLEKSHSQAVENEKKAKRDAIKYLEKYCKLAKKSNTLLIKIKSLEDNISLKSNELKESQEEYAKLESVLQVYKTERKGHQCLKKDRDFLLAVLWRVLKKLEEEQKESKIKKITETFFKRFERELGDLKLEDFRHKVKNVSGLTEKEESEFLFSPGSHVLDSVDSDFIDTDLAPESVKSSSCEEFDTNCVLEGIKPMESIHTIIDTEQTNDIKHVEVNVVENQPLPLPDLSLESFTSQDSEGRIDSNLQEKDILKDCVNINALENNGFNLCHDGIEEDNFTTLTSFNVTTIGNSISDPLMQNKIQGQDQCSQNNPNSNSICLLMESKENIKKKEKVTEQIRKTYCSKKFKVTYENDEIMKTKIGLPNGCNIISNTIGNVVSTDIDISNDSSETIGLDTDVCIEDIGSIPDHIQYCEKIYDFLTLSDETRYLKKRTFSNEDSHLLFLTEKELINELGDVNFDSEKTLIRKSPKTISVFDVEHSGNSMHSGCVRDEELENTCVEFNSDSGNVMGLKEVPNKVFEENEKNNLIEQDGISRKPEDENKVDEKSQVSNFSLQESNSNCNSNQFINNLVNKNHSESGFTEQENIPDEEVYRILKYYKNVPLLSPIKENEPSKRRKLFVPKTPKLDKCNESENVKVLNNLKSMKSCGDILHNIPNKIEEEALLCNPKTDNDREKKMVDKIVQTDGKEFLKEYGMEEGSNGINEKIVFSETLMRKLCKLVWKKNFKKLKYLNKFAKMCKVHSSCFDVMKTLVEMIDHPRLYTKNRRENLHFMKAKAGQGKSNLKCDERKMSYWQVEDVEVTNVISKNEPLFNYPKVEDCSFFTQSPVHYYSKNRLNNSTVKSEETRGQKNKMSFNCFTSNQQIGFAQPKRRELEIYCDACECNNCLECGVDSDIGLRHCRLGDTVNDFEKRCDSSAGTHETNKNVEVTPKSDFENIPEVGIVCDTSNTVRTTTDYLEKCVEVKKTEFQSSEACSKSEESVLLLRRSSRIRSRNTQVMKEDNHTNDQSRTPKESQNSRKVDLFGVSLPPITGNSTESHETSSTSINEVLPIKKVSEESTSPTLKNKFEELFGNSDWQSDCSSSESDKVIETAPISTEIQKKSSTNFQINENGYTSDVTSERIKRRAHSCNSKSGSANNKKIKLDESVGIEDFKERFTENEVPVNDTFSSQDIKTGDGSNVLDSIMTAMTKQTEFFKVQATVKETEISDANYRSIRCAPRPSLHRDCIPSDSVHRKISKECRMKGDKSAFLNLPYYWSLDNNFGNQTIKEQKGTNNSDGNHGEETKLKSVVQKEIRRFLKIDINTVEEGEEKVKSCVSVLRKASENIIANAIVNEIMANVDEELQEFERPAPPLTQTQHRIMIILTVFSNSDEQFHRISNQILNIIWSKIFPENFFWPDDSLEMATRFYSALCKRLNNFKGIWKFCFKVITSMRQRWCIPIFVVLQVWPDIIHNANEVQNNILVKTFVNIILHTPKSEDMRRKRQEQKLLAVKHLLINFYNFDLNSTIEGFTQTLWKSFVENTSRSADALVLLSKCRNWSWTRKNIIAKLLETLESWMNGNGPDIMVSKVLDILQQITVIFPDANTAEVSSAKDVISALAQALNTEKLNPNLVEKVIRILCSLCHYSDVREILVRLLEKIPTSEPLYADIKKALSSKNRKPKGFGKTKMKAVAVQIKKKTRKKEKKKKGNSSRQKGVLDIK